MNAWLPFLDPPLDGTKIDLWTNVGRITDVWWGKPKSYWCPKEQYVKSDGKAPEMWCHDNGEEQSLDWLDGTTVTHYMIVPETPEGI